MNIKKLSKTEAISTLLNGKHNTHETIYLKSLIVFGNTQRQKDFIMGYFKNKSLKRSNTTKNYNPNYGKKLNTCCFSIINKTESVGL